MPLFTCLDCGTDVSTLAPACPRCGRPVSTRDRIPPGADLAPEGGHNALKKSAGIMFVVILLGAWLVWPSTPATGRATPQPSTAFAGRGEHEIKAGYPGCVDSESLLRIGDLAKDKLALVRFLSDRSNGCEVIPQGTVTVEDSKKDLVKVRAHGEPTSYWTLSSALQ